MLAFLYLLAEKISCSADLSLQKDLLTRGKVCYVNLYQINEFQCGAWPFQDCFSVAVLSFVVRQKMFTYCLQKSQIL